MAPDAGVGLVEDRRGGGKRLCGPYILDGQKVAVAQHHFECGEPVLVRSTRSPPHRASAATLAGAGLRIGATPRSSASASRISAW